MVRMLRLLLVLSTVASLLAGPALAQPAGASIFGVWRNPKDSVHVDVRPCGKGACGFVVWASAKAQADAREGGTQNLVGLELFRNLVEQPDGRWRGKVFVPDLNATFSGSAEVLDAGRLRARGCLIANIACKSQIWTRVAPAVD